MTRLRVPACQGSALGTPPQVASAVASTSAARHPAGCLPGQTTTTCSASLYLMHRRSTLQRTTKFCSYFIPLPGPPCQPTWMWWWHMLSSQP